MTFSTYGRETTTIDFTDLIEQAHFCFGEIHSGASCQCQETIFDHDEAYLNVNDVNETSSVNQIGYGTNIIHVIDRNIRNYKKLNASGIRLLMKFKNPDLNNVELWLKKCLSELLKLVEKELNISPLDRVGLVFTNANNVQINFSISFRPFNQYNPDVLLIELDKVMQSNINFFIDDSLIVNFDHVKIPIGYGRRAYVGKSSDDYYKLHKRSIYNPFLEPNDNNMCLAVALAIAIAHNEDTNRYNMLTYAKNYHDLIAEAHQLCRNAQVDLQYGGGIFEIKEFQDYLGCDYRITVFASRDGRNIYFKSCHQNYKYSINLLLDQNHYSVILNATAAFAVSYFCTHCSIGYTNKFGHRKCTIKCDRCFTSPPCQKIVDFKCNDCNRTFRSTECFVNHLSQNICASFKFCTNCFTSYTVRKREDHLCGYNYCKICKERMPIRHECFMATTKPKCESNTGDLYIFYDFESFQTKAMNNENTNFEHEVMLCVAHQSCKKCRDNNNITDFCEQCGVREHIFNSNDVIHDFMEYLGKIDDKFKRIILLAHNGQKYDNHFLIKYMYLNSSGWPLNENSLIMNGSKLMRIKIGRYSFIDSLNFFSTALSKLPAMFSLENNSKGFYPHFFNKPENLNYIGNLPDLKYYGIDNMKEADRAKLLDWYNQKKQQNYLFDNKMELLMYCREDVNILRNACLKFRSIMYELTKVEPFYQVTLAGTAMSVFTSMFLKKNHISIIPRNGYRFADNQSIKAIKWLEWEAHKRNMKIQTAANGREVRIARDILVDGFFPPNNVFSFLGCYWHQCNKCFPIQYHTSPHSNSKMAFMYESCIARAEKIRSLGYNLIEMWEHDFDKELKTCAELNIYIESLDHLKISPLDPRDSFMGGRTGVCKLYHKISQNEKILYYDVTSLYPYINKYGKYPIGKPKILLNNDLLGRSPFDIEGILKVDILPPKSLYHPVLGVKMHNKLMFILCYKCALEKSSQQCKHTESERIIHGTYISDELRLAIQKGYKIIKIYEAWEYEVLQYDKNAKIDGIFGKYIDTFLKIKSESSGYPPWCKTEADKKRYIDEFYKNEGIKLDDNKIKKNAGYRSLSKLLLNSLWGRLGMRQDKTKKIFVKNSNKLLDLMVNPSIEVNSFYGLCQDSLLVSYKLREECHEIHPNVNVVLAAYTSAQARMHLYNYLDRLQDRCLYYDTDSVIFISRCSNDKLELGDNLGELTDELAVYGDDSYISEAVFTSEKSYAFIVKTPGQLDQTVCKVKGINLSHKNSQKVNFDTMKNLVLGNQNEVITLQNDAILRTGDSTVYTTEQKYKFKVNATKRIKLGSNHVYTLPYGYL